MNELAIAMAPNEGRLMPITPEQQIRAAALLCKHGYKGEPHFKSMTAESHFLKP